MNRVYRTYGGRETRWMSCGEYRPKPEFNWQGFLIDLGLASCLGLAILSGILGFLGA